MNLDTKKGKFYFVSIMWGLPFAMLFIILTLGELRNDTKYTILEHFTYSFGMWFITSLFSGIGWIIIEDRLEK